MNNLPYTAGTVSIPAGSNIATGSGVVWTDARVQPWGWLVITATSQVFLIETIDSATQLMLAAENGGAAITDAAYTIISFPSEMQDSLNIQAIRAFLATAGIVIYRTTPPTAGDGVDGTACLVVDSLGSISLYTKDGGAWTQRSFGAGGGGSWDVQVANLAARDAYDAEDAGFAVLVSDIGDGRAAVYTRVGAAGTWTAPAYFTGPEGAKGDTGNTGNTGNTGDPGPANSLSIGTVASGASAGATITGTAPTQTLNLTLPKGDKGDTGDTGGTGPSGTITSATATGLAAGASPTITLGGTASARTMAFGIPKGDKGDTGAKGDKGDTGDTGPSGSGTGDMLASVYDPPGKAASVWNMANMDEAADAKIMTLAERTKLSGIAANAEVNVQPDWNAASGDAQILNKPALGTVASLNTGTASGNVPVLDGSGKLVESILPAIAVTDVNVVASQAAMLALTAQTGDIAVRSDINKTFALSASPASTLANWIELRTPTDAVLSVAGKTGAVTLAKGDVGLGNVDNTTDSAKPVSTAQQAALDGKQASLGYTPVQQGTGAGQMSSAVKIGWDGASWLRLGIDATDFGSTWPISVSGAAAGSVNKTGDTGIGGYTSTAVDDGTKSSGTYTPTPVGGNYRKIVNNGAFTLVAPAASGCYDMAIDITNGASAGAVAFSGFVSGFPKGDALTTVNGNKFKLFISKTDVGVTATIQALQ